MRKIAKILTAAVFAAGTIGGNPAVGATTLKSVRTGTPHQALMSLSMDGSVGYAVGGGGQILSTRDAGREWKAEASPTAKALLGVSTKGNLTIAVGQMGTILVRDGGGAFTQVESDAVSDRLLSVSVNGRGTAVAVGAFGSAAISHDRGRTWTSIAPNWETLITDQGLSFSPHLYAAVMHENGDITISGEAGTIIRSCDLGRSWIVLHKGNPDVREENASILALDFRDDGVAYAVGQEGTVLRSADWGATWTRLHSSSSILSGVRSTGNGKVVAVGMYSMLVSQDDGRTWSEIDDPNVTSSWYVGLARSGTTDLMTVGKAGAILLVTP
ncbi:photosystem II stability/assembly factor-like uncharacterized protein [Panacagrimonas perspica]|uniref:Photosystem II stability/assembly factor-like uncharacterized protein n=1 Tax=Panacagrimonas perspica TaxID=381431 RepID=A0A4R7P524_9GAMM|nr:hypothetical protein [Panacagrimonas perspica]TDU28904.1 photosystem II stability/assembly factor-like uncharacterized protein [Panacagrimonas perspica]THD02271.1 hypothetical protein B1810_15190 [Panacagrimonas perspica]